MGPAVSSVPTLRSLFEAGVDVCRLNFSHGDLSKHAEMLNLIREAAKDFEHPIAVLGDLCGPKIRLGQIGDVNGTGGMPINVGDELVFQRKTTIGENGRVSTTLETFVDDVQPGHRIYIEDGLLRFIATEKSTNEVRANCIAGGVLKNAKGINLPDTVVKVPSITDRDWECVDWALQHDLDYLALSFVRSADDLKLLRGHLQYKKATDVMLIAKIEKAEAIKAIDAILAESDGLMVARGDLGVEMDVAEVPIIQKDLIRRCQMAGKPVIVATQMLQSMIENSSPTRAEVSDVANAILDGTDAVMLSAETSVGKFPIGAVAMMAHVGKVTEKYLDDGFDEDSEPPRMRVLDATASLARGAWRLVHDSGAKLLVIWSQTGSTARVFSKQRFHVPIISLSADERVLRRMAIHYGVTPQVLARPESMSDLMAGIDELLLLRKFATPGDRICVVAGWSQAMPNMMNGMILHTVGETWMPLSPTGRGAGVVTK